LHQALLRLLILPLCITKKTYTEFHIGYTKIHRVNPKTIIFGLALSLGGKIMVPIFRTKKNSPQIH
jgi:hypothetical protein